MKRKKRNKKWTFPVRQSKPEKRALVHGSERPKTMASAYLQRARSLAYERAPIRNHREFVLGILLGYIAKKDQEIAKLKANR